MLRPRRPLGSFAGLLVACGIGFIAACTSDAGTVMNHASSSGSAGDDDDPGDPGKTSPGGDGGGGTSGGNDAGTTTTTTADGGIDYDTVKDPLSTLSTGQAQLDKVCARNLGDAVSKAFCGANNGTMPPVTSLVDLQKLLGLDFKAGNIGNGTGGNPAFAMTGHSSSLVGKFTSAINPRVIIFTPPKTRGRVNNPQPLASFTAMGFVRGEEFVELVSNDPTNNDALDFFLFKFQHDCDSTPAGCTNADTLTPAVESNFSGVYSLYNEDDIKNTIFDCQQCHQTGGPQSQKILRMQELQNPWGHFFRNNRNNGQVLMADYQAAHGMAETYGGIPGGVIFNPNTTNNNGNQTAGGGPDPAALEGLVENQGFKAQPNEYNTGQILKEVQAVNKNQPASNVPMGSSATWLKLYQNFENGLDIAPPYHDIKVTDPTKLATATTAYQNFMAGTITAAQFPDIRDVFLDAGLSDMSFQPAANLTGAQILTEMCQQCHNKNLDQTQSREKFRVDDLANMSREEKDLAIHRLNLPVDVFRKMPPPRFRVLSAAEIQLATDVLNQ